MPVIELRVTPEQFNQLPRNPAYRYEYLDGIALLTPRPKHFHAMLDLVHVEPANKVKVKPLRKDGLPELVPLFAASFRSTQPFGSVEESRRPEAARHALEKTQSGGDGPMIEAACFVARDDGDAIGAIVVTLLPDTDPCDWDSYHWTEPPSADAIERGLGRPHLTWILVSPLFVGAGIGTSLLRVATNALLELGYRELLSTFIIGNDASLLWHWRNGFRLLRHPGSARLI